VPLAIALLCMLLAAILWQRGTPLAVEIGSSADRAIVEGFHKPEENLTDTYQWYRYRWSRPAAQLTVPAHALPGVLELRGALLTDGTRVTLGVGERMRVPLPASTHADAVQRFFILLPPDTDPLGWAHITIDAEPPAQQHERPEKRNLGMLVASIAIRPVAGGLHTPPLLAVFIMGMLPLLLATCLHRSRLDMRLGNGVSLAAGVAVVLVWHLRPFWIQPFLLHCFAGLLVLAGMLWWVGWVAAQHPAPQRAGAVTVQVPTLLLLLVGVAGVIPLYLLLKYDIALALNPVNLPIVAMVAALLLPVAAQHHRRLLVRGLVVLIAAALLIYGLDRYIGAVGKGYSTDFTALFRGAHAFLNGDSLYNFEHLTTNHLGDTYKYPPFFVFLMGPFTRFHYDNAIWLWHLFNLALLIVAVWLLWRWSGQPLRSWSTLGLAFLVLTFKPLVDALGQGQADIIILTGLAAALLALGRGRWGWWGAALAFPAAVKLYPAYLLLHGVVLQRWRSIGGFALAGVLLALLSVVVFGWQVHTTFLFEVLPTIGGGTAWAENQTLNGFLNRLATDEIALQPGESLLVRGLTYLGALLCSVATALRVRHMTPEAGYTLWIVALLIIVPIAWMHYLALLVIPWYHLLVRLERAEQHGQAWLSWRSLLCYCLAWMLLCYGNQWSFFDRTWHGPLWVLLLSFKWYGLLLLWVALAFDPTAAQPERG
jgi:hypothetical protein